MPRFINSAGSHADEAKLVGLVRVVKRAEQCLVSAIEEAAAGEMGVELVANGVLRINIKKDERSELA